MDIPNFEYPIDTVSSAFTAWGSAIPVVAFTPEGMSTDTISLHVFIHSIHGNVSSLILPEKPVPNTASTMRSNLGFVEGI